MKEGEKMEEVGSIFVPFGIVLIIVVGVCTIINMIIKNKKK